MNTMEGEMMNTVYKGGEALVDEIRKTAMPNGALSVWNLGQSGVLIKGSQDNGTVAIDPYLTFAIEENDPSTEFKREFPPPISPEELKGISGVLATHFHDDHLDLATVERLASVSGNTQFVVPASHLFLLNDKGLDSKNVIPVKDEKSISLGGFQITPIPAAHTDYESDGEGHSFYWGYLIDVNGVKIFHSGDTIVDGDILEKVSQFHPDIVFLPINGSDFSRTSRGIVGNMSDRDACDFGVKVGADMIIPVHYDMFSNNRENPAHFVDYLFHTYPSQKFHMMAPGERFIYYL